jgi:2-methylisocitrate lyase-like PEP mutase family enzyme
MTSTDLRSRCDLLRSLHRPGDPVVLPNAWDVASARAVVAAGFPVVATTREAVAATIGHEDEELARRSSPRLAVSTSR